MRTSKEYRAQSWNALSGNWSPAVICCLVFMAAGAAVSVIMSLLHISGLSLISSILLLPMEYAFMVAFVDFIRGDSMSMDVAALFKSYRDGRVWGTMALMYLYTCLWTLLLVVPGVIKGYSYSLTPYILRDCPELENNAAIEKSMALMDGHKMELFLLDLSFIGWYLLSIVTLGIGILWILPYHYGARAAFYEDIVKEA